MSTPQTLPITTANEELRSVLAAGGVSAKRIPANWYVIEAPGAGLGLGEWKAEAERLIHLGESGEGQVILASSLRSHPEVTLERLTTPIEPHFRLMEAMEALADSVFFHPKFQDELLEAYWADGDAQGLWERLQRLGGELPFVRTSWESPRLSIVIPVHNDGDFLPDAIQSAKRLPPGLAEVILVDDGSTDLRTIAYLETLRGEGYRVIRQANQGLAAARNAGIEAARSPIILPLDADNQFDPSYVRESLRLFDSNQEVDVVYSAPRRFGTVREFLALPEFRFDLLLSGNFIDACALFRKAAWEVTGGYDDHQTLRNGYEDWEFWLRVHLAGRGFHRLPGYHFSYRVRADSLLSKTNLPAVRRQVVQYIVRKHRKTYDKYQSAVVSMLHQALADSEQRRSNLVRAHAEPHRMAARLEVLQTQNLILRSTIAELNTRITRQESGFSKRWHQLWGKVGAIWKAAPGKGVIRKLLFPFTARGRFYIKKFIRQFGKLIFGGREPSSWADRAKRGGDIREIYNQLLAREPDPKEFVRLHRDRVKSWGGHVPTVALTWLGRVAERALAGTRDDLDHQVLDELPERALAHVASASEEFIWLIRPGDNYDPTLLYRYLERLRVEPDLRALYCDWDHLTRDGLREAPHYLTSPQPELWTTYPKFSSGLLVRRKALVKALAHGPLSEEWPYWDLMLRLLDEGTKGLAHVPGIFVHEWEAGRPLTEARLKAGVPVVEAAMARWGRPTRKVVPDPARPLYLPRFSVPNDALVSILVPTRNKSTLLKECLDSLFELTTGVDYEVIVIDNGSDEKKLFELFDHYRETQGHRFSVLRDDAPFNFAALNNKAARAAKGNYLLCLNNDTVILHEDWLAAMVEYAQWPEIGVVGAKLLYEDNTVQHAGVRLFPGGPADHMYLGYPKDAHDVHDLLQRPVNYTAVTGACLMLRREVFEALDGYDERFHVALNDIDLCVRAVHAGYRNLYLPHVEVRHLESKSRGASYANPIHRAQLQRENALFIGRWNAWVEQDPAINPLLDVHTTDILPRLL